MTTDLQITARTAPPLTQSLYELMACPTNYVEQVILGNRTGSSLAAGRGTEIHHVMSEYVRYCAKRAVAADWGAFNRLSAAVTSEAGTILDGVRDHYLVNFEHLFRTEEVLMLDCEFQPTEDIARACYKGTLDAIYLLSQTEALIDDYKSHPTPFEPTTYQGMLYPFLLFAAMPALEKITFRLVFVRWPNLYRTITWTRADLGAIAQELSRARLRQQKLHEDHANGTIMIPVYSGPHCNYCPLQSAGTCPIRDTNPYMTMPIEERVRFAEWIKRANAENNRILRDYVQVTGNNVTAEDANGSSYTFGTVPGEGRVYPVLPVVNLLERWKKASGEDPFEWTNLRIASTGLRDKLNAKKRYSLRSDIEKVVRVESKPTLRLLSPNQGQDETRSDNGDDW